MIDNSQRSTARKDFPAPTFKLYGGCLFLLCAPIAVPCLLLLFAESHTMADYYRDHPEWRQKEYLAVRNGATEALVMDSRLLPMLADDSECRRRVTRLTFAYAQIRPSDASRVAQLINLQSMAFYGATGTRDTLSAAAGLPVRDVSFGPGDFKANDYKLLQKLPLLQSVTFEMVMPEATFEHLQSELPDVEIELIEH